MAESEDTRVYIGKRRSLREACFTAGFGCGLIASDMLRVALNPVGNDYSSWVVQRARYSLCLVRDPQGRFKFSHIDKKDIEAGKQP
jgi:hypothetical protein